MTARVGLRANLSQFLLLVAINAMVGGMVGQERTVLPLLATRTFHVDAISSVLTFLVAFGLVKALANGVAGIASDRIGRKPVLIAGWLAGVPVPFLLMWAPSWLWVVGANVLLGVNQGFAWSMTVTMKADLAGERRRGFAMGVNEAAGYGAVALTAGITGYIASRSGLRPEPFFVGVACAAIGLGLSVLFVKETHVGTPVHERRTMRDVFVHASFREPTLSSCAQAGLVNNMNDGLAWGLFPLWFAQSGLPVGAIGALVALYPGVWGIGQLVTGALSDRAGRKPLIVAGMLIQGLALVITASVQSFGWWAFAATLLGAGTAMVYPTLLATVGDVADAGWRASAIGVYRLWRDAGFAAGALLAGLIADLSGIAAAIWTIAGLTAASGLVVALQMNETLPARAHRTMPRSRAGRSPL